jgi:transmembrane sensor
MSTEHSTAHRRDRRSVTDQATGWVAELAGGGADLHPAFTEWLKESPRHVEEYLLASALYKALDRVDAGHRIDARALIAEAAGIIPLDEVPSAATLTPGRRWRRRHTGLTAAAALAGLAVGGWLLLAGDGTRYMTDVGEMRSVELADGSVMELNTRSRVRVRFSDSARTIRLLSGEALFKVASDPNRPFVVHADTAAIEALGTQFNVYLKDSETTVAVIEGAVRISSSAGPAAQTPEDSGTKIAPATRLTAGRGARIHADGRISELSSVDPVKVTAWRQRRLMFVDEPLAHIVVEFNRYNSAPALRVEGDYARARELTGVFDANDPQSLVQFLENLGEFELEFSAEEILIRPR